MAGDIYLADTLRVWTSPTVSWAAVETAWSQWTQLGAPA